MSVKEIQAAVKELSTNDKSRFFAWVAEYEQALWDKQIEEDSKAGRLDHLLHEARQEYASGKCREI